MTNLDLIREYIKGEREYGACNHIGYQGDVLINYGTKLCSIDRDAKKAEVNGSYYSRTTSKIQNYLKRELEAQGYEITLVEGDYAVLWNWGYMGAPTLKASDFRP